MKRYAVGKKVGRQAQGGWGCRAAMMPALPESVLPDGGTYETGVVLCYPSALASKRIVQATWEASAILISSTHSVVSCDNHGKLGIYEKCLNSH